MAEENRERFDDSMSILERRAYINANYRMQDEAIKLAKAVRIVGHKFQLLINGVWHEQVVSVTANMPSIRGIVEREGDKQVVTIPSQSLNVSVHVYFAPTSSRQD